LSFTIFAQTGNISRKVVDEPNQPLPGASVFVNDSQTGTQTDPNGNFRLTGFNY
jgi:hypothetical protein